MEHEITNLGEDPYKILGVNYSDNLEVIRSQFLKLVLIYHPDRIQGNAELFDKIKKAYTYIFKYKKQQEKYNKKKSRTFEKFLEQRETTDQNTKNQRNKQRERENILLNPSQLNYNSFNKLFEKNKIKDAYDESRENFLTEDKNKKMQISIVKNPKIFPNECIENVRHLGVDTVHDFSVYPKTRKNIKQASCFDIKYAYENKENLESMGNTRTEETFNNSDQISKISKLRENISYKMSPQEKLIYDMKKKQEVEEENKRLYLMKRQEEIANRQFLRLSKFITH